MKVKINLDGDLNGWDANQLAEKLKVFLDTEVPTISKRFEGYNFELEFKETIISGRPYKV